MHRYYSDYYSDYYYKYFAQVTVLCIAGVLVDAPISCAGDRVLRFAAGIVGGRKGAARPAQRVVEATVIRDPGRRIRQGLQPKRAGPYMYLNVLMSRLRLDFGCECAFEHSCFTTGHR